MEQLKLRFAAPQDALEWLENVPDFDKGIMSYPSLRMLCAYNGEPVGYLPIHKAVMLESLALKPGIGQLEGAAAMRDLVKGAELNASSDGISEIYFIGNDKSVVDIAVKNGFEVLPWPVLRMRL